MFKPILDFVGSLLEKSGMNKGDATSGLATGGVSLAVIYMLFVSQREYQAEVGRLVAENSKLWHQVHVTRDTLAQEYGIFIPNVEDEPAETNNNAKTN